MEAILLPYNDMTLEQIQELLTAQATLDLLPGVLYIQPEYTDLKRQKTAICVYIDAQCQTW